MSFGVAFPQAYAQQQSTFDLEVSLVGVDTVEPVQYRIIEFDHPNDKTGRIAFIDHLDITHNRVNNLIEFDDTNTHTLSTSKMYYISLPSYANTYYSEGLRANVSCGSEGELELPAHSIIHRNGVDKCLVVVGESFYDVEKRFVETAYPDKAATITSVRSGGSFVPFTDDMTITDNVPDFKGTSTDLDELRMTIDGEQVGWYNNVFGNGGWHKMWRGSPLADGEYQIKIFEHGVEIESFTVHIDAPGDAATDKSSTILYVRNYYGWFVPFTDGMTLHDNVPYFRGTSNNLNEMRMTIDDQQVGWHTTIRDDGGWDKLWREHPLSDGMHTIKMYDGNQLLGTATINIDFWR